MSIDRLEMLESILDAFPYPIVFVDDTFIIRYMNRQADYQYQDVYKRQAIVLARVSGRGVRTPPNPPLDQLHLNEEAEIAPAGQSFAQFEKKGFM